MPNVTPRRLLDQLIGAVITLAGGVVFSYATDIVRLPAQVADLRNEVAHGFTSIRTEMDMRTAERKRVDEELKTQIADSRRAAEDRDSELRGELGMNRRRR